jgi:uncharacterized protein (TIGR02302 family)
VERAIWRSRGSLGIERFLPGLWPALGFAGLYLSLALFGLFAFISWDIQALLLAATVTAVGLSLDGGFKGFHWPQWKDGARRLERDNGLKHRPISEGHDRLIGEDPFAVALWTLHQARALALTGLKVRLPHPDVSARDPRYLRYGVLVLAAASLAVAGVHWRERLVRAFDSGAAMGVGLDAWVDPPAYTGLPPLYLAPGDNSLITVPVGSILNLRVHGAAHAPGLQLGIGNPPRFVGENGEYAGTAKLTHDARVRVRSAGHLIGNWRLKVMPDTVPSIAFDGLPSATEHQALKTSFKASDDYGVASAKLVITPHNRPGPPLTVDLPLATAKNVVQTNYNDLTPHPYAGLTVDAHLEARDAIGQTGKSNSVTFKMPARVFTDPLARALIEQRQNLATSDAKGKDLAATALDALAIAPEKFYADKPGLYLGLRAAFYGVKNARSEPDISHVEDLLWQMATSLEQQGLADAAAELRRLQNQISQALQMRAPQDVVDNLLQQYNDAMQRYMQALANNPDAQQQLQQQMQSQDTKQLTQKDLQDLLNAIQQMAAAGNREQAQQMMAMLQNLLENLKVSKGGQGGEQNKALNDAIQKLGDMMGKERGLLDKTMRQKQGNGDPKDGGSQGLAQQQSQLRQQLQDAAKGMDPKLGSQMNQAGQAMQQAQGSLNRQDLDNASNEEKNALDALRQGAQALSEQAQQQDQSGRSDADPLGRSKGMAGTGVKIPGITDLARAREILQELRKRAGQRARPQEELDYYDRLLKEF